MPAAIAIPAIATAVAGGASAGASIYGAHRQSSAARDAARMESDYNNRALDFAKQQYAAEEKRRAPYRQAAADYMAWKGQGSPMAAARPFQAPTLKAFSEESQPAAPVNAGSIREFYRG